MQHTNWIIVMALIIAPRVAADMITFEHESVSFVTGQIGNIQFNAPFVITAVADTDDRIRDGDVWSLNHAFASIEIEGVGTFDFITPTVTAVNNGLQVVGFGRSDLNLGLFFGPSHPDFTDWDMTTSIGPIRGGDGSLGQWFRDPVETTGGVLAFDIADGLTVEFTATVIPAPAALALFGIAALTTKRRRRSA